MDEIKLIRSFLEDEKRVNYGFVMLQDYYLNMRKWMKDGEMRCYRSFCILGDLYKELANAFHYVNMNLLCDDFEWAYFVMDVLCVAYKSAQGKFANAKRAEIQSLMLISRMLGMTMPKQKYDVKKRWYKKLFDFSCMDCFEDERKFDAADCVFAFLASQLLFEKSDLIENAFYGELKKTAEVESESVLLSFLFFSCYLYYLTFKERENVVNDICGGLRERCVRLIESTQETFKMVLYQLSVRERVFCKFSYEQTNIFNKALFKMFRNSLRRYEHYLNNEAKILVMDECVDEFISFCLIYIRHQSFAGNISLESFIDGKKIESLYLHFRSNEHVKGSFKFFAEKFIGCDGLDKLMDYFVEELSDCYKNKLLKEGTSFPKDDVDLIKREIECSLKEPFMECLVDDCENIKRVDLLCSSSIPQHMEIRNVINSLNDSLILNLLSFFFYELSGLEKTEILRTSEGDEQILKYVEKHKDCVYIGSEALLQPYDIAGYYKRYNEAVQNLKKIRKCGWNIGMFVNTKDFEICIKNVEVERRPKTIGDLSVSDENGVYRYSPNQGEELSFTKEELEEYLKKYESVLSISAEIGYRLKTDKKMDFLFRGPAV